MKKRNPGLVLLLGIVTLSVYFFIWHFKFQNELREESGKGILPVGHLMLFLFPGVNIVYYIIWLTTLDSRLKLAGSFAKKQIGLYIVLMLTVVGNLFIPSIVQAKANKIGSEKDPSLRSELRTDKYAKYILKK